MFSRRRRNRSRRTSAIAGTTWAEDHSRDIFTYEMVMYRELEQDALMWQTPALSLTAQSFLLTIALAPSTHPVAAALSSALALIVAVLAVQLMQRHRYLGQQDRNLMAHLSEKLKIPSLGEREWTHIPAAPAFGMNQWSSTRVWTRGLWVFATVNGGLTAFFTAELAGVDVHAWSAWLPGLR